MCSLEKREMRLSCLDNGEGQDCWEALCALKSGLERKTWAFEFWAFYLIRLLLLVGFSLFTISYWVLTRSQLHVQISSVLWR
jgi:hypothetical protein